MEFWAIFLSCLALLYGLTLFLGRKRAKAVERERRRRESDLGIFELGANFKDEIRVRDKTRRGPEAETHLGKTQVRRDRGTA